MLQKLGLAVLVSGYRPLDNLAVSKFTKPLGILATCLGLTLPAAAEIPHSLSTAAYTRFLCALCTLHQEGQDPYLLYTAAAAVHSMRQ
jgi:hypothetical protein